MGANAIGRSQQASNQDSARQGAQRESANTQNGQGEQASSPNSGDAKNAERGSATGQVSQGQQGSNGQGEQGRETGNGQQQRESANGQGQQGQQASNGRGIIKERNGSNAEGQRGGSRNSTEMVKATQMMAASLSVKSSQGLRSPGTAGERGSANNAQGGDTDRLREAAREFGGARLARRRRGGRGIRAWIQRANHWKQTPRPGWSDRMRNVEQVIDSPELAESAG